MKFIIHEPSKIGRNKEMNLRYLSNIDSILFALENVKASDQHSKIKI